MGFYANYIFPIIMDKALNNNTIRRQRQSVLADAKGNILELGFGTGLNLACYPPEIDKIITIDTNEGMHRLAQKRMAESQIKVEHRILDAQKLPFEDESFDTVVSTFTLCSIDNLAHALQEVRRVLRSDGQFIFFEHGISPDEKVSTWQNRLTPINKILAVGCHMNRPIDQLISEQHLVITRLEKYYIPKFPVLFGYVYRGIARKDNP